MKLVENQTFDKERVFYGSDGITIRNCVFDGEADGESAFKESKNITVSDCRWNLRYPFWHVDNLRITNTELTDKCRAALWYSQNIEIKDSKLHGIKALRECANVQIENSSVISAEFGWSVDNIKVKNCEISGEYFMLRSSKLSFDEVKLNGKYSFQYITDSTFENCTFNTKDAFWHAKNVIVRNSVINGEYLAWYAENITFENCTISGTQPLCYCKGLKLINCQMYNADLSFEKSTVEATVTTPIVSIKNPLAGYIKAPAFDEIIADDQNSTCKIEILEQKR
jgi:hypothetical protein